MERIAHDQGSRAAFAFEFGGEFGLYVGTEVEKNHVGLFEGFIEKVFEF